MKIAVVGSGVSGLVAAWLLAPAHEVVVFEADDRIGGHVHTVDVDAGAEGKLAVDTGFIVYNDWTYPNFIRLLDRLGVATQASSMSFSVRSEAEGFEYNGTNWNGIFAQRRNLVSPGFLRMLCEVVRFNRIARVWLSDADLHLTLGEFLKRYKFGRRFLDHYVLPMGAAIWSSSPATMLEFPAASFLRFFDNHGMLNVEDRPVWRVIQGGSKRYVEALMRQTNAQFFTGAPVRSVHRKDGHVQVTIGNGETRVFDHVVMALHADQALSVLKDPTLREIEVLSAFKYQPNETILHRDVRLLPRSRRAWAAWNYHVVAEPSSAVHVTYAMNILQNLPSATQYLVTLNRPESIDPALKIGRFLYHHPVYTRQAIESQSLQDELNGPLHTSYCGAYWGHGFHEDGVKSALAVCRRFGLEL